MLEPVGALPVIIEDDVLVGGNCGVYEGTVVKRRAVLGTGTILNRSTPVYDLVRGEVYHADRRRAAGHPRRGGGRGGLPRDHERQGQGLGNLAVYAGDREVSRLEDGHEDPARRSAAVART